MGLFRWDSQYQLDFLTSRVVSTQKLAFIRTLLLVWHLSTCVTIAATGWHFHGATDKLVLGHTLSWISYACVVLYLLCLVAATSQNSSLYKQACSYPYHLVHHRPMTPGAKLLWVAFEVLAPVRLLVCIVYWTVLFPERNTETFRLWATCHLHIPVSMLLEIVLNRFCVVPAHCVFLVLAGAGYIGYALLIHAQTGEFVYSFLDYTQPYAALKYICLVVGSLFLYICIFFAVRCRNRCTPTQTGERGRLNEHKESLFHSTVDIGPPEFSRDSSVDGSIEMTANSRCFPFRWGSKSGDQEDY
mmetsp:Transcript_10006/g.19047  ORF Transcript_10006/g.19047 Transcript_10006/m.19047 type:complete len:301 (-) Transcript_10006:94-996(-)